MSGLIVLEGKWSRNDNISIKSLFDVLIDINFQSPHAYYFENFANSQALRAIVHNICGAHSSKRYIYVGAHGENNRFWGSVKPVTREQFCNTLRDVGGQIRGLFLGSCLFGNRDNAQYMFQRVPNSIRWIAGYGEPIDWIASSALDMLFWNTLFSIVRENEQITPNDLIVRTCEKVVGDAPGLVSRLKFQVFTRTPGPGDALTQLIDL